MVLKKLIIAGEAGKKVLGLSPWLCSEYFCNIRNYTAYLQKK
jgi:hypothetical protein